MHKLLIGSALALGLLAAAPAGAADIVTAPVYPGAPALAVPGWTGFYVGANAGYSWGRTNQVENKQGFTGGGQIGYDYQFGHFVLGLEADLNWRKATHDVTGVAADGIDIAVFHSEQNFDVRGECGLDGGRRHRVDAVPMDHWGRMAPLGLRNRNHQFPGGDTGRSEFPGGFTSLARSI